VAAEQFTGFRIAGQDPAAPARRRTV